MFFVLSTLNFHPSITHKMICEKTSHIQCTCTCRSREAGNNSTTISGNTPFSAHIHIQCHVPGSIKLSQMNGVNPLWEWRYLMSPSNYSHLFWAYLHVSIRGLGFPTPRLRFPLPPQALLTLPCSYLGVVWWRGQEWFLTLVRKSSSLFVEIRHSRDWSQLWVSIHSVYASDCSV